MKTIALNEISKYVKWDYVKQKFLVIKEIEPKNIYLQKLLKNLRNGEINMLNTYDILLETFPYVEKLNQEIINNAISMQECVKKRVYKSIYNKQNKTLKLEETKCTNKNHINITKRFITELNNMIYKFDVKEIFANRVFLNRDFNKPFIGKVDILMKTNSDYIQVELKTSKTNYLEKNNANLYLNKILIETSREIKMRNLFILNVRENQVFQEYEKPKKSLENLILAKIF
ncbi:hypothetical protein SGLAD_v1c09780 [Spiroplasma gladiatoris]|uniref:Uncharacterized protein n=1 Tax=Spiroplasma gladiatoris TaxID=2143 RepID=A0A4P7AIS0_9MOLU|nr:hypothetical protein [Spiroplasma gladiatoris]QBQ08177.1 hypothetical protein SGLAD_v1c09780 [Spiroplasma gladiatoris]